MRPLPDEIRCPVVGLTFNPNYPECIDPIEWRLFNLMLVGRFPEVKVTLRREPGNDHDSDAVAVDHGAQFIGHVPRHVASRLAPELDRGVGWGAVVEEVVFNEHHQDRPGLRLRLWRTHE